MKYEIAVLISSLLILPIGLLYWLAGKNIDERNDRNK